MVATVRHPDRTRRRTTEYDAAFVTACERGRERRPVQSVHSTVGHRADHGHRPDIRRHQRPGSVRVLGV